MMAVLKRMWRRVLVGALIAISVNCHGWVYDRPPIASTVESFRNQFYVKYGK